VRTLSPLRLWSIVRGTLGRLPAAPPTASMLDRYVTSGPSPENALDIFKGEWTSKLPGEWARLQAGHIPLFEDNRVQWGIEQVGGVAGKSVLELGPLEGGHTYMLERNGAASIEAVEAHTRGYLKCLVVKELLELRRARFLCGDFVQHLRTAPGPFDFCLASGVLYHMRDPVELLTLVARAAPQVYLWSHYYDEDLIRRNAAISGRFTGRARGDGSGFPHTLYRHEYQESLTFDRFCGGTAPFSQWMSRDDILACLRHLGWTDIRVNFEVPDHPNGPCFAVVAMRG